MPAYFAKPPHGNRLRRGDPLARGLAGAWFLTEGGGAPKLTDAAGKNAPAAPAGGLTWAAGRYGRELAADGTGSVDTGLSGTALGTPYSVACLFRIDSATGGGDANPGVISVGSNVLVMTSGSGTTGLRWQHDTGGFEFLSCSATIVFGSYYHVLVTSAGTGAGNSQMYVNGLPAGNGADAGPLSAGDLTLCKQGTGTARTLVGRLVYAAAWSRALPAAAARVLAADPFRMIRRSRVPVPLGTAASPPPPPPPPASNLLLLGCG